MIQLRKTCFLALLITFLGGSAQAAEVPNSEVLGKYGFDWLKPQTAKCAVITEKTLLGVKSCQYNKTGETGSFTGNADFYTCKVSAKSEYMAYKTQARCKEELETMQSNGD